MCAAKSYISRYKLEAAVLEEVNNFLDRVVQIDCSDEVMKNKKGSHWRITSRARKAGMSENRIY